jgi:hypothetical protein
MSEAKTMAIYCSKCGMQHPDDANFCMGCGQPFKPAGQPSQSMPKHWEYKDITVPFPKDRFSGISDNPRNYDEACRLGDSIILASLQQEGRLGWQAEGPTDFRTLDKLNLLQKRQLHSFNLLNDKYTYKQVTIRLKRLVP